MNPALQRRLVLPGSLIPGDVHRVTSVQTGIGGKGQDVVVALSCLAKNNDGNDDDDVDNNNNNNNNNHQEKMQLPRLLQFLGRGATGDTLLGQLDPHVDRIASFTIRTQSPLRVCTSLVGTDSTTELVEPSGKITSTEMDELWRCFDHQNYNDDDDGVGSWDGCAFMGSLPPDCPTDIYAQLYHKLTPDLCLIDSLVGLPALLETIHLQKQEQQQQQEESSSKDIPFRHGSVVLKINVDELCALAGLSKKEETQEHNTDATVAKAIGMFLKKFEKASTSLTAVALTNGPDPAYVASMVDHTLYRVPVPQLPKTTATATTMYPIGAGDAVAAGTLAAWQTLEQDATLLMSDSVQTLLNEKQQRHQDTLPTIVTAFSFGLACGTASCLQPENSVLDVSDVLRLFRQVGKPTRVHEIPSTTMSTQ